MSRLHPCSSKNEARNPPREGDQDVPTVGRGRLLQMSPGAAEAARDSAIEARVSITKLIEMQDRRADSQAEHFENGPRSVDIMAGFRGWNPNPLRSET